MCRPVTCRTCRRTTWSGCGQHVAQVKASVPADQWCPGHDKAEAASVTTDQATTSSSGRTGLWGRLLDR